MSGRRKSFARAAAKAKRSSPLKRLRKKLRRGSSDVRTTFAEILGAEHGDRWVDIFLRAEIATVAATPGTARDTGRPIGKRHTARATIRPTPVRREKLPDGSDDPTLRALALTALAILDGLGPGRKRVWHSDLWLGRDDAPHEHAGGIASQVRRRVRTIEKYFGVFRSAGLFQIWQPPTDEKTPRTACTRKGRAYNCYELVGEMPRQLQAIMVEHYGRAGEALAQIERAALTAAPPAAARPTENSASLAATFLEMAPEQPP